MIIFSCEKGVSHGIKKEWYLHIQRKCYDENCKRIILSEEAHKKIVAETFSYGDDETGGVLIGYIYQGQWYVTDVIDAGIKANHTKTFFTYDEIMSIIN